MWNSKNLDDFLKNNLVEKDDFEKSQIEWLVLASIAEDYENQLDQLRDSAEMFARVMQRFPGVHSVRWRIKETDHLLEKIVRKRTNEVKKYGNIDSGNYYEIVTDLVGLRALHLFKEECFLIDDSVKRTWNAIESPVAYVREGDPENFRLKLEEHGFEVKKHPDGYRSLHYILETQPLQRRVFTEIQVRTIFEEGWSEIDHRVRYPNFSNDRLVSYFLTIFNRLAGSADEMGTFVQGLTSALEGFDVKLMDANLKKEEALSAMDTVLSEMNAMKKEDVDAKNKIKTLQQEVAKLRSLSSIDSERNSVFPMGSMSLRKMAVINAMGASERDILKNYMDRIDPASAALVAAEKYLKKDY